MSLGWFLGGTLFGSVGLKALGSKDAKKVYSKVISYGLDAKDSIMETADGLKEGWDDVYAEAKELKADRDAEKDSEAEIIEDTSSEKTAAATKSTQAKSTAAKKTTTRKTTAKKSGRPKKN